jgi:hypothetical protein
MNSPTSWLIEDRRVLFADVTVNDPRIRKGLDEDLYREISAAELYGILRTNHGHAYVCFESPVAVYMCLVCRTEAPNFTWYTDDWFSIPWENYEWFCYRYLSGVVFEKEKERLDWRKVGF